MSRRNIDNHSYSLGRNPTQDTHPREWQATGRLTVPVWTAGRLLGVLFVDPSVDLNRVAANEVIQQKVSVYLHDAIAAMEDTDSTLREAAPGGAAKTSEDTLVIRNIGVNNSLFIDGHYLIKGVAGAALWILLRAYASEGKTEFSARELRLEADMTLPDVHDNLGQRLAILQRRLAAQSPHIYIEKISRGRFRLVVNKPFRLVEG